MPMPKWFGHINKRVFNPREIKKSVRPVITHVGQVSGVEYNTPLDAHPVAGGYVFILVYGSGCDWVKNILASGSASLKVDDVETDLRSPKLINKDAAQKLLPPDTKMPPKFLRVDEFLQMDNC